MSGWNGPEPSDVFANGKTAAQMSNQEIFDTIGPYVHHFRECIGGNADCECNGAWTYPESIMPAVAEMSARGDDPSHRLDRPLSGVYLVAMPVAQLLGTVTVNPCHP